VDAIQEFNRTDRKYSAEYGLSANQINLISKSGTNDLHGALFWFVPERRFRCRGVSSMPGFRCCARTNMALSSAVRFTSRIVTTDVTNNLFWLVNWDPQKSAGSPVLGVVQVPTNWRPFLRDDHRPGYRVPFPNNTIPSDRIARLSKVALENHFWPRRILIFRKATIART